MFFEKYDKKTDGAIRFFDIHSKKTKIFCVIIFILCLGIMVVSLFPAIWVFLSSFKDIKEFRRNATILPESFNIQAYVKTWNDLKFLKYYVNSFIYNIPSEREFWKCFQKN